MMRRLPRSSVFPYTTLFRSMIVLLQYQIAFLATKFRRQNFLGSRHTQLHTPLGSLLRMDWRTNHIVFRSEEHTSELQSRFDLVCRLLLEKKKPAPRARGALR